MHKQTVHYVQFLAPGAFFGESWTQPVESAEPRHVTAQEDRFLREAAKRASTLVAPGRLASEADATKWPGVRNRGLLQASKQAAAALKKWHMGGWAGEHHGSNLIYEARSYLEPAIKKEEAFRTAVTAGVDVPVPTLLQCTVLRDVVRCLRETGRYVDEEGEATNALDDLAQTLAASGVGVPRG